MNSKSEHSGIEHGDVGESMRSEKKAHTIGKDTHCPSKDVVGLSALSGTPKLGFGYAPALNNVWGQITYAGTKQSNLHWIY